MADDPTVHVLIPTTAERRPILTRCIESIHTNAGYPHIVSTYENYREGFIRACHRLLKDLKPETIVWSIGNDTVLHEPNTIARLMAVFVQHPSDVLLQPDDGFHGGNIATMPFCTAQTMLSYGIHFEFFHNYCDVLFTELMCRIGKYVYCPDIHVEHWHWSTGKSEKDDTYNYAITRFEEDRAALFALREKFKL